MGDKQVLVGHVLQKLTDSLRKRRLGDEYYYYSLPLAAIDAVFSAQAKYPSVQNVIQRYCSKYDLIIFRSKPDILPPQEFQENVTALLDKIRSSGIPYFSEHVFENRSVTSGRLKTEVLFDLLETLEKLKIQTFQDMQAWQKQPGQQEILIRSLTRIHGIGEATYRYFLMLAGDEHMVKPDTMILRFIKSALGRSVHEEEAVSLIQAISQELLPNYPDINPRLLDYLIWTWQRNQQIVSTPSQKTNNAESGLAKFDPARTGGNSLSLHSSSATNQPAQLGPNPLAQQHEVISDYSPDHSPKKGDVFKGKIYDLSLWDSDGWRRRDIRFYKREVVRNQRSIYLRPGDSITLIGSDGSRYNLKFSKPDLNETICLGMPSGLKHWYKKQGFDSQFVNSGEIVYFEYSGVGNEFNILTEQEHFVRQS